MIFQYLLNTALYLVILCTVGQCIHLALEGSLFESHRCNWLGIETKYYKVSSDLQVKLGMTDEYPVNEAVALAFR